MKRNTCLFDGREYIVWCGSCLEQAIHMIPESFGVFPDYGRGTDAYRAIGYGLVVEGDELVLNDLEVTATGDCYFPIAGVAPLLPRGYRYSAIYSNLSLKIGKTGSLILLKNQERDRGCVSGWLGPSDFEVVLELEFIGGKLLQGIGNQGSLADNRNLLAHSRLEIVDQAKWFELEKWMRECFVVERTPEDYRGSLSAIKAGDHLWDCMTKFPGVRKHQWPDREMDMVGAAAQGKIVQQDAFELLCLLEKVMEMHRQEEEDFALQELPIRGRKFWKEVEVWMTSEVERWPQCLHDIVRRQAGADIEFDSDMSKLLVALVSQFEASGKRGKSGAW